MNEDFLSRVNRPVNKLPCNFVNDKMIKDAKETVVDIDIDKMYLPSLLSKGVANKCNGKCADENRCKGKLTEVYIPDLGVFWNFCEVGLKSILNQNILIVFVKGIDY